MRSIPAKFEGDGASHEARRRHWPRLRWATAVESGLIAGGVLIVLPQGAPWAALTSFSGAVMGRSIGSGELSLAVVLLHLLLAVVYALIIAMVTRGIRNWRALPMGAAVGLGLYALNWAFVSLVAPQWTGNELRVAVAHILFGLFAAAAYAGFTQKKTVA